MTLVVAGPRISRLVRFMAKIVVIGARTLRRFSFAKKPLGPDGDEPRGDWIPGYVSAMTTGRAVCREK